MEAVVDPCRRFHECEGCSHCSPNPRRCEYCADPWDECLCDFKSLPVFCDECDERVESCECEDFHPTAVLIGDLSALSVALESLQLPELTAIQKGDYLHAIGEAVALLRTHALPESHPWAVK